MNYKKLLPIIGIIILVYIIFTLDLEQIYSVVSNINPLYSFLSLFAIIPVVILTNIQWQILLKKQRINVSFFYSLKNIFIGYFYGFISPGGIGAYTRALYLENESKSPLGKCLSNIVIFNTIDYLSLLLLGAIGAILISSIYPYLFAIIVIVIFFIVALLLFFLKKEKSKNLFLKIIQTRIFATVKDRLTESLDSFYEDLPRFKDVLLPFIISIIGWVVRFAELFFISRLFLIDVPFVYFILIIAVANVIASIPITVYGLGTREASLISMFFIFDVIPEKVLSLSLFWFIIIWFSPSIIGAFITYFETKKFSKLFLNEKSAERFSNYMKKYPELYRYLAAIVKENISNEITNPMIVDLGVGPGLLSEEIINQIPKAKVVGVDPSEKMLNLANKNVKKDVFMTMLGNSEKIPLEKSTVDVVVSRFSLTYWKNPKDSFKEINRILKPGGVIVLEALNKRFSKLRLFAIKTHMFFKGAGSDVIRYHSDAFKTAYEIEKVERFLKNSGFDIIYKESNKKDWKFVLVSEKKT
jgi:glycosyltransferase 2 family protein